jgi:archaellum component FlaC
MELIFEKLYSFAGLGVLFFLFLQLYILFFSKNIANKSSTILSTGILGTFIGIASGLLFFDPSDIDSSIPPLLQGMSVSFLSSITGIAISIVAKNKEAIESNKGQDDFLITLNKNLDNAFQSHLGSSLKKFNESVDSLLKLHKTNEKAIKFLTDEFRETAKELKGVNNELNKLEAAGNIFQTSAESIEKVLQSLDSYSERTISSFKEIEQLGTNINRSIPQIRENIDFAIKPLTEDLQITLEKAL